MIDTTDTVKPFTDAEIRALFGGAQVVVAEPEVKAPAIIEHVPTPDDQPVLDAQTMVEINLARSHRGLSYLYPLDEIVRVAKIAPPCTSTRNATLTGGNNVSA